MRTAAITVAATKWLIGFLGSIKNYLFKNNCSLLIIPMTLPTRSLPISGEFLDLDRRSDSVTVHFCVGENKVIHAFSFCAMPFTWFLKMILGFRQSSSTNFS